MIKGNKEHLYNGTLAEIADELFDNYGVYNHIDIPKIDDVTNRVVEALEQHPQMLTDIRMLREALVVTCCCTYYKNATGSICPSCQALAATDRPEYKEGG